MFGSRFGIAYMRLCGVTLTAAVLDCHGAEHPDGFAAPNGWLIHPFPRVPMHFLFLPSKVMNLQFKLRRSRIADAAVELKLEPHSFLARKEENNTGRPKKKNNKVQRLFRMFFVACIWTSQRVSC